MDSEQVKVDEQQRKREKLSDDRVKSQSISLKERARNARLVVESKEKEKKNVW